MARQSAILGCSMPWSAVFRTPAWIQTLAFWLSLAWLAAQSGPARGQFLGGRQDLPASLHGQIIDWSDENGADNRIWSEVLGAPRSLYVYLPPDYDPGTPQRVMFWFHAYLQKTGWFAKNLLSEMDSKMASGELPGMVIVFPDGSQASRRRKLSLPAATLFMNSEQGEYESHVMDEVWPLVHERYNLSDRKEDHLFAGASMGGNASMRMALRHRDRIGAAISIFGPLDLRYQDICGGFLGNIPRPEPRTNYNRPRLPVARLAGVVPVRLKQFAEPLFDLRDPEVAQHIRMQNPRDLLEDLDVRPGELKILVAYGRFDDYNFDSQGRAFARAARERGLEVEEVVDPWGRHSRRTADRLFPSALDFIDRYWAEGAENP